MTAAVQPLTRSQDLATVRILRMAVGVGLALAFSQAVNWTASFLTPVLVSVILCLPLPAPKLKFAVGFLAVIGGSLLIGLLLLPMLHNQPAAGVLLILLCTFHCFYYGAKGGSAALVTFLLLGIAVIPVIGSESIDAALLIGGGLIVGAIVAFLFIWIAYALFPDPPAGSLPAKPPASPPANSVAIRDALRSSAIVVPAFLWMLFASETTAYAVVLLKLATMGQQSSLEDTRAAGDDLLLSTFIGGIAAIAVWNVLQIWPNVVVYGLLFTLCSLVMGPRIFAGQGLAERGAVWSYGLLTMMIIVAPGAADTEGGAGAGDRFSDRITMFVLATIYAVAVVYAFDKLWPPKLDTLASNRG
jgi:hypothetical protein